MPTSGPMADMTSGLSKGESLSLCFNVFCFKEGYQLESGVMSKL
jgi:hypothetical protein